MAKGYGPDLGQHTQNTVHFAVLPFPFDSTLVYDISSIISFLLIILWDCQLSSVRGIDQLSLQDQVYLCSPHRFTTHHYFKYRHNMLRPTTKFHRWNDSFLSYSFQILLHLRKQGKWYLTYFLLIFFCLPIPG